MMEKVIVIGCPGSGKSTFSKKLENITKLPLYHLDMLFWNKDKTTVSKEIFIKRLKDIIKKSKWIIDGNYGNSMEIRIKECDTVFFLDYPTEVCLNGVKERKGKPRSDMPWVENDNTDKEFIDFIKNFNTENRHKIIKLLDNYSSKNIIIFRSRMESEEYILSIRNLFNDI